MSATQGVDPAPESAPLRGISVAILTLVHPDFLPSVHALSEVLGAGGYRVDVFTFSSPAPGEIGYGPNVRLHDLGPHRGSAVARHRARHRFRSEVSAWANAHPARAVIATCPFTFLEGLRIVGGPTPLVYFSLEMYDARPADLVRSPFTAYRNWRALKRLGEATLVCVPSSERAGWLAARAGLSRIPATVLNSPSQAARDRLNVSAAAADALLPASFRDRPLVLNTGGVSSTQCLLELVDSVRWWPERACLAITNVGDTPYARALRRMVAESPRTADIALLPMVSRLDMLALQARASVGACLLREGDIPETSMPAPNKVGEYFHAGLHVLGLHMPFLDQLEHHGAVVLADSLAPRALGAAVSRALALAHVPNGRERPRALARTWYRMEAQIQPILRVIDPRASA